MDPFLVQWELTPYNDVSDGFGGIARSSPASHASPLTQKQQQRVGRLQHTSHHDQPPSLGYGLGDGNVTQPSNTLQQLQQHTPGPSAFTLLGEYLRTSQATSVGHGAEPRSSESAARAASGGGGSDLARAGAGAGAAGAGASAGAAGAGVEVSYPGWDGGAASVADTEALCTARIPHPLLGQ